MFPDGGYSVNELKHLTEKVTAVAALTRMFKLCRPHNAHPTTQQS